MKWCWLEFAQPDIKTCLDTMEKDGNVDHVLAIPVFISISSHSERDIPNCLGTKFTPCRETDLPRYIGNLPITYASPMDHGKECLTSMVSDNCAELMQPENNPNNIAAKDTAVITVSHGDGCEHFWGHLHSRIKHDILEKVDKELTDNTWCYVQTLRKQMVQERFHQAILDAVVKRGKKRVLVLSCFNGTSGRMFLERLESMYLKHDQIKKTMLPAGYEHVQILGDETWMGDKRILDWCVDMIEMTGNAVKGFETEEKIEEQFAPPINPPFFYTRDLNDMEKFEKDKPLPKGNKGSKGKSKGGDSAGKGGAGKGEKGISVKDGIPEGAILIAEMGRGIVSQGSASKNADGKGANTIAEKGCPMKGGK